MNQGRLGEPIELPWWAFALLVPPIGIAIAGLFVDAPLLARFAAVVPSLVLAVAVVRIVVRVPNTSMQSVWISLAYGLWIIFPVAWGVALASGAH